MNNVTLQAPHRPRQILLRLALLLCGGVIGFLIGLFLGHTRSEMLPFPDSVSWLNPAQPASVRPPAAPPEAPSTPNARDALDRYFSQAAEGLHDCGRTRVSDRNRAQVDLCVQASLHEKAPFYARYDLQGIDSEVAAGILYERSQRLSILQYDSWGCASPSCVQVNTCQDPQVSPSPDGLRIACANVFEMFDLSEGHAGSSLPPKDELSVTPDYTPPQLVHRVDPKYPDTAVKARIEGTVILEVEVDRAGDIRWVKVSKSIPLLDQAAITAVRQWKYAPARDRGGRPVAVPTTIQVKFAIPPGDASAH